MSNNRAPPIPGFFFDEERGRYFAITNGENRFNKRYTNNAIQSHDRRKRQDRKTKEKENILKENVPLALNRKMANPVIDPVGVDLALRLGHSPFSYLPEIATRLKNLKYNGKVDYAIHLFGFGLKPPENQVIFYQPASSGVGTTFLPLGLQPLKARASSSTHEGVSFQGVKTASVNYLFFDGYPIPFQRVDKHGNRVEINYETLREIEVLREDEDSEDFDLCTYVVSRKEVYLLTPTSLVILLLDTFDDDQAPALRITMPSVIGAPQDPIINLSGLSFVRSTNLIIWYKGDWICWDLTTEIYRHFKYTRIEGDAKFTTYAVITNQGIMLREAMQTGRRAFRWLDEGTLVGRQKHNNLRPISFLHKSVLVCEEDKGNFVAIDLQRRQVDRFKSPVIERLNLSEPEYTVFFHHDTVYISTESKTFIFK